MVTSRSDDSGDAVRGGDRVVVFPDNDNCPPHSGEPGLRVTVAGHVASKLVGPPVGVGPRTSGVFRAGMPEAAPYVHGDLGRAEDDVDLSSRTRNNAAMEAIPEPEFVKLVA